jgi:hypothetical protein
MMQRHHLHFGGLEAPCWKASNATEGIFQCQITEFLIHLTCRQQASLKQSEERATANTIGRQHEDMSSPSAKPEARQPAAAAAEADPWASLQSAYRIQDTGPETPTASGRDSAVRGSAANRNKSMNPSRTSAGGGVDGPKKAEMVVLDEEEGYIQEQPLYAGQTRVQARLAAKPAAAPKQGGWGQGKLAQAGTLMLGDDQLHTLAPPQAVLTNAPVRVMRSGEYRHGCLLRGQNQVICVSAALTFRHSMSGCYTASTVHGCMLWVDLADLHLVLVYCSSCRMGMRMRRMRRRCSS